MSAHEGRRIQGAMRTFITQHFLTEPKPTPLDNVVKLYDEYVGWAETFGEAKMYYYQFKNELNHLTYDRELNHV